MAMRDINIASRFIRYVAHKRILKDHPLFVVDIGASGGVEPHWEQFEDDFRAIGFEPLISECDRLNNGANQNVQYMNYFVISDEPEVMEPCGTFPTKFNAYMQKRMSLFEAFRIRNIDCVKRYFNTGERVSYTDKKIHLDGYFNENPVDTIDFIKIDTDGCDFAVLHGAREVLNKKEVLGVNVEIQFHAENHPYANTFSNIDNFLTKQGFMLSNIDTYRCTTKDLPDRFCHHELPLGTPTGQLFWGDALYLRNSSNITLAPQYVFDFSPIKLVKLAGLYELFGLSDCAVELINCYASEFDKVLDLEHARDLLAQNLGIAKSYKEHMDLFYNNHMLFYQNPPVAVVAKQ